jgi:hypothetical protein
VKDSKVLASAKRCVQTDWLGWLPTAKLEAFRAYSDECEALYLMWSVSLDESMCLHNIGATTKSLDAMSVTPALCRRLTTHLQDLLGVMEEHVGHYEIAPSVTPLKPGDFRGFYSRFFALRGSVLNRALQSQNARFVRKASRLQKMIADVSGDFYRVVEELASSPASAAPSQLWASVDTAHFDLNTCFRESIVLLKCFLRALPDTQLSQFQEAVRLAGPSR